VRVWSTLDVVSRITFLTRGHGFDVLVFLAVLVGVLEVTLLHDALREPRTPPWFAVPAVAALVLPLLGRHRYPFAAPVTVWLLAAGLSFVDALLVVSTASILFAGMAAAFVLGNLDDQAQARIGLAIVLSGAAIVVYNDPNHSAGDFASLSVLCGISWLAGLALRERTAQAEAAEVRAIQAEREREAAARIAVAEERARIARELHDIVAHAVSVMVLQAGAVRHKLPEALGEDANALRDVERTGRTALTEMRRLLGAMRHDGQDIELTPQPGLDSLDALAEEVRQAGLPVRLHVEGAAFPLSRAIDLSAYRIIQEGLTNSLKHARASCVDVTVRYESERLQIEVRDNGVGTASSDGLGHGLIGIRERVKIYGGEMTAGPALGGGFILSARLPIDRDQP
jgi:signal transduction histidine kinase